MSLIIWESLPQNAHAQTSSLGKKNSFGIDVAAAYAVPI